MIVNFSHAGHVYRIRTREEGIDRDHFKRQEILQSSQDCTGNLIILVSNFG